MIFDYNLAGRETFDSEEVCRMILCALQARAELCARTETPCLQTLRLRGCEDIVDANGGWMDELRKVVPVVDSVAADSSSTRFDWEIDFELYPW